MLLALPVGSIGGAGEGASVISLDGLPLKPGDHGPAVADLHRRLRQAGYAIDDPADEFTGSTLAALVAFQHARGLIDDGVCGAQTWASLVECGHQLGSRNLYLRAPMMRGDDVSELQRRLGAMGFDAGRVDGIFGPDTARAVEEFQRNTALPTDAIVGRDTFAALERLTSRTGSDTLAAVRERERLRQGPSSIEGRRVVIGDLGGAAALAEAVGRSLGAREVEVAVLLTPDGSAQAKASNEFGADVYLGLIVVEDDMVEAAYFSVEGFESYGGGYLAELICAGLDVLEADAPRTAIGRRLPALRETKMPAVVCRLGPARAIVTGGRGLAGAVADCIISWLEHPFDAP